VMAAHIGEPSLTDPKPTLAPDITRKIITYFNTSLRPETASTPAAKPASAATTEAAPAAEAAAPAAPAAPLACHDVPTAAPGADNGSAVQTSVPGATSNASSGAAANSMGVEIISPSSSPKSSGADGGLKAVGPTNTTPLPAVEKAGDAPDAVNTIQAGSQPAAQAPNAKGKKTRPAFDKSDESSSKHKKKKGLDKLNPF
jgi:outer membrane protein assembly factor BamD